MGRSTFSDASEALMDLTPMPALTPTPALLRLRPPAGSGTLPALMHDWEREWGREGWCGVGWLWRERGEARTHCLSAQTGPALALMEGGGVGTSEGVSVVDGG